MLFWVVLTLPFVYGQIDFMDCGSESIFVEKIDIPGCDHTPCLVYTGNTYQLHITTDLIGYEVSQIKPYASVVMWGAHIPIQAQCESRCITNFPFWPRHRKPRLSVMVEFPNLLLHRPAHLYLWAESKSHGRQQKGFCVALQIDIRKI